MSVQHSAIDSIFRQIIIDSEHFDYSRENILLALTAVDSIVIMAHGEGAHCNLEPFVMCGITGEEQIAGNRINGGCSEGKHCKRADGYGLDILPTENIVANTVALLVCNAASETGGMYPTNASIADRLKGHNKTVLAPTQPINVSPFAIPMLLVEAEDQTTLEGLANSLNAQYRDPNLFTVLSIGDQDHPCSFMAPPPLGIPRDPGPQLAPRTRSMARDLARNALVLEAWRQHARQTAQSSPQSDQGLAEAVNRLTTIHTRLTELVNQIHARSDSNVLDIQEWPSIADSLLDRAPQMWQDALARACGLQPGLALESMIMHGTAASPPTRLDTLCERCGSELRARQLQHILGGTAGERIDCRLCGTRSIATADELIYAEAPPSFSNRTGLLVLVRARRPARDTIIKIRLRDKGRGITAFATEMKLGSDTSYVEFPQSVLNPMTPDLHTLSIDAFSGFDSHHLRLRVSKL